MNKGASRIGRFEEFINNRVGGDAYGTSYNSLISAEDMEVQERGSLPATNTSKDVEDLVPIVYMTAGATRQIVLPCILRTLLDTGSRKSLISSRCLPYGVHIEQLKQNRVTKIMAGSF